MEPSEYVTIVVIVPETHADAVREAMGHAGAGKVGAYSHGSFSVKGISRFIQVVTQKSAFGARQNPGDRRSQTP